MSIVIFCDFFVLLRQRGARLLDEVERSGARRLQTARAWPRAAQQFQLHLLTFIFTNLPVNLLDYGKIYYRNI